MPNIDWRKAKKFRDFEEKYDPGTELKNGRVVGARRPDSLAARAAKAEREWLADREQRAKAKRQKRRQRREKAPTHAQERRMDAIRDQLEGGQYGRDFDRMD